MYWLFVYLFFLIINVAASDGENLSYSEIEKIGDEVKEYIIVDNGMLYFYYQNAQNNNESPEVIEQGLLLESISSNYAGFNTEGYSTRSIGLPIWGNYCGPGYGGKDSDEPVTDVLDEGCRRHDQCYKWSLTLRKNCKCNKDLVDYIDAHKSEMSGTMAKVAWAIRTYFNTVGQIGC
ncbi:TPA: phospholipase [Enterococcus faecium]